MHDIVDTAAVAGSFSTLIAALTAADLAATLKGAGPFTVFAPTDAAFAKLAPGMVDDLMKPTNRGKLAALLTLHVLPGIVMSGEFSGMTLSPRSVNGEPLRIDGSKGIKINGATVAKADIACTNGVIHVIDRVLLPKPVLAADAA